MKRFRKSGGSGPERYKGQHRFEHWYCDNQVYFITARCRDRFRAFETEEAKAVFWDRFNHYVKKYQFTPWVTTLIDNHYHTLGYLKSGEALGPMMQHIHGSVAKLVNDLLPQPHPRFWQSPGHQNYFDGCIRDEMQCRRAYRYTLTQCRRHGMCQDWRDYRHTCINVDLDRGIQRAHELGAFMERVPYTRYEKHPADLPLKRQVNEALGSDRTARRRRR